jgi:uncharacterized membrane protein YbhN (UPF0104 family)
LPAKSISKQPRSVYQSLHHGLSHDQALMPKQIRSLLSLLLKIAVSAALLYVALRSVDLAGVAERLAQVRTSWLAVVFLLVFVQVILLSLRWRQIVIAARIDLSIRDAIRLGLIATFFNQTLPSTIGGDAARVVMLGRHARNWAVAAYSVLIDRAVGLVALAAIVVAFLPATLQMVQDPIARAALILMGSGGIAGGIVFAGLGAFSHPLLERFWFSRHIAAAARVLWQIASSAKAVMSIAALSILIHIFSVAAIWAAAKSIAAPLDFIVAMSIVPPVILISTVPISIAGWGVRESAMITAFAYAGLAQGEGLLVSVIFGAATFAVGAIGGIVWILSADRPTGREESPAAG